MFDFWVSKDTGFDFWLINDMFFAMLKVCGLLLLIIISFNLFECFLDPRFFQMRVSEIHLLVNELIIFLHLGVKICF